MTSCIYVFAVVWQLFVVSRTMEANRAPSAGDKLFHACREKIQGHTDTEAGASQLTAVIIKFPAFQDQLDSQ
jgi:hypothetical protein